MIEFRTVEDSKPTLALSLMVSAVEKTFSYIDETLKEIIRFA